MEDLKNNLMQLDKSRFELNEYVTLLKQEKEKFELQNKVLIDKITEIKGVESILISNIHTQALKQYDSDLTKDKSIGFGVKIRLMKSIDYDDATALKWATEHNIAISLNKTAFKTVALSNNLDFVTIKETPSVTIPMAIDISD